MRQQASGTSKGSGGSRKLYSEKKPTPKGAGRPQASLTAGYRAGKGTSAENRRLQDSRAYNAGKTAGKKARGK